MAACARLLRPSSVSIPSLGCFELELCFAMIHDACEMIHAPLTTNSNISGTHGGTTQAARTGHEAYDSVPPRHAHERPRETAQNTESTLEYAQRCVRVMQWKHQTVQCRRGPS